MSKDFLAINAGRVILTKVDPDTGALSTKATDKRILTETCDGITRSKTMNTYEIPDGNSNYPAGIYETGVAYTVGINLTTLNTATLAFLQNSVLEVSETAKAMKNLVEVVVPRTTPFTVDLYAGDDGAVVVDGDDKIIATVLDSESKSFEQADVVAAGSYTFTEAALEEPAKLTFHEDDAGKTLTVEYSFTDIGVESYDIDENHINPVVQIEIIHETLSKDKTKRYKNNSIISRAQLTGNIDENLAKQHAASTLNFAAIKPAGTKVVMNKKVQIPL